MQNQQKIHMHQSAGMSSIFNSSKKKTPYIVFNDFISESLSCGPFTNLCMFSLHQICMVHAALIRNCHLCSACFSISLLQSSPTHLLLR